MPFLPKLEPTDPTCFIDPEAWDLSLGELIKETARHAGKWEGEYAEYAHSVGRLLMAVRMELARRPASLEQIKVQHALDRAKRAERHPDTVSL